MCKHMNVHCSVSKHSTGHAVLVCLIFLQIDPKSGEVMKSNEQAQAECLQLVSAGTDGYATESPQMLLHFVYIHMYVRLYILVLPLQRTVMFWDLRPPPPKPGTKPPDPSVPSHLHLNLTWKPFIKVPTYLCTHLNRYVHTRKSLSLHSIQYCTVLYIQYNTYVHYTQYCIFIK